MPADRTSKSVRASGSTKYIELVLARVMETTSVQCMVTQLHKSLLWAFAGRIARLHVLIPLPRLILGQVQYQKSRMITLLSLGHNQLLLPGSHLLISMVLYL